MNEAAVLPSDFEDTKVREELPCMTKQYFILHHIDPSGIKEWKTLDGQAFFRFCRTPEAAGRHFADLGEYVVEMLDDEFASWRADANHARYLRKLECGYVTLSLYRGQDENAASGEELIPASTMSVEETAIRNIESEQLNEALNILDPRSYYIIYSLFLSDHTKSEACLAQELGLSQQAISWQKKKILEKLKISICKP